MIKIVLAGIWGCAVMMMSSYGITYWQTHGKVPAGEEAVSGIEYRKVRPLSVPLLSEGVIQGYIVVQFVFTADARVLKESPVPLEIYLLDEAFRLIYSDEALSFKQTERYDLAGLAKALTEKLRVRLKGDLVKEVLVDQFNYVAKADVRR
ncbi:MULTISPECIES: hypothetical protein [unclassified Beijerinckia]|uniref:hypothetical protein n=1 Tax=unclassified Beijerinckia TaxID=2638183 RepID=UPI000897BB0D|nr:MULTISPECIES: hypothetical protein [unclassified Beijerinckia]MDH7798671.1 hypothetical protein [Beijerinckia sp. GAS462]SED28791.1 hypothetical protein SAMN05443249_4971 [Beijerinckia sp. 28-YEA-48]